MPNKHDVSSNKLRPTSKQPDEFVVNTREENKRKLERALTKYSTPTRLDESVSRECGSPAADDYLAGTVRSADGYIWRERARVGGEVRYPHYLIDRVVQCAYTHHHLMTHSGLSGVPQGMVLGPIMFLIQLLQEAPDVLRL